MYTFLSVVFKLILFLSTSLRITLFDINPEMNILRAGPSYIRMVKVLLVINSVFEKRIVII